MAKAQNTDNTEFKFKVVKNVTLPLLKQNAGETVYIKITEPFKIGKKVQNDKAAAVIAHIVNLVTGEEMQFLVPAVMQGVMHDEYGAAKYGMDENKETIEVEPEKEPTYIGKCFAVSKLPKAGKQYHPISVQEIEPE
jgi:hypothetical protein